MSSSVHEGPTQMIRLYYINCRKKYSINYTEKSKKFCLSLHYNGANSYLFVNGTEIIKFKAKDSEIAATPLCLGNISKDSSVDTAMMFSFNVLNVIPLKCISMNNPECIIPKTINVNSNEHSFYPYCIKVNKCSGSCNNINDPYAKICVSDVVKNINAKVFI